MCITDCPAYPTGAVAGVLTARECRDFEELSLRDYETMGKTYGLEKFWAFHHYHGFPADCKLEMNSDVCFPFSSCIPARLLLAFASYVCFLRLFLARPGWAVDDPNPMLLLTMLLRSCGAKRGVTTDSLSEAFIPCCPSGLRPAPLQWHHTH